ERRLGFPLFERDRRTVALSGAGELLLTPVRELLAVWDKALAEATRRAREAERVVRVGFHTSVAGDLYRNAVTIFSAPQPGRTVGLRLHPWSDATAGLLGDSSDVAFLWLPVPNRNLLACETLRTEPRHVALWRGHPLAARKELSIEDLLDEPFVALPPSAGELRDYWLAVGDPGRPPLPVP